VAKIKAQRDITSPPESNKWKKRATAEPLNHQEKRILTRLALKFPREQLILKATLAEPAWKKKSNGQLIPCSDSGEITAI
jgi:hypothetical protein